MTARTRRQTNFSGLDVIAVSRDGDRKAEPIAISFH